MAKLRLQKAIQVRYLTATSTKNSRLKIWAEQIKPITVSIEKFNTNHPVKAIEQQGAELLANKYNWLEYDNYCECERVLRGGQIANGDHVFVIVDIPFQVKKSFREFKEA